MSDDSLYDIRLLVVKVAAGDESAFRTIFDSYKHTFYAIAYKLTRSADTAEEIVQEVFITLWNSRTQVAASGNPKRYIRRILYNSIYAYFRRLLLEKQLKKNLYQAAEFQENTVEELLFAKENSRFLNFLVDQLPPQQQLVYRLSKQEGLSRDEIAAKLCISPNTVRNHLAAAVDFIAAGIKKGAPLFALAVIAQF